MIFVGDETGKRAFMQIGQLVKAPDERKVSFFQKFSTIYYFCLPENTIGILGNL
jgi:hypothetical protein